MDNCSLKSDELLLNLFLYLDFELYQVPLSLFEVIIWFSHLTKGHGFLIFFAAIYFITLLVGVYRMLSTRKKSEQ